MHGQIGKDAWSIFEGSRFSAQRDSESEPPILAVCGNHDLCDRAWVRKTSVDWPNFKFRVTVGFRTSSFPIYLDVLDDDLIGSGCDVNSCATNRTRRIERFYHDRRFRLAASA